MSEQESLAAPPMKGDEKESAVPAEGDDDVFFVSLQFKGTAYEVPVQKDDPVVTVFDFVHEVLDFPQENCKLIFKGKVVRLDDAFLVSDLGLVPGSKMMLMASSANDVAFVQDARPDPLVKGFAEEERDDRNRRKRARAAGSAWGTKQDPEYRFGSIKAEFKYSNPPPYEAEKLLERLATDPGIIEIMKTRHFKVGVFTEMSPVEAQERMAKRGTPNMDLLGYNMNNGDMVVLRLRTDTLKGFRPYHDLINTLIHELTHNVWSEHDHNFWKLFGELKAQYMRFHRFWSHSGQATDGSNAGQFGGFATGAGDEENTRGGFGQVLGGTEAEAPKSEAERRDRALLAAEARKVGEEPPARNFLTGNGTWVMMCPCGQVHDPAECPNGGVTAADDAADERSAAETMAPVDAKPNDIDPRVPAAGDLNEVASAAVGGTVDGATSDAAPTVPATETAAAVGQDTASTVVADLLSSESHEGTSAVAPEHTAAAEARPAESEGAAVPDAAVPDAAVLDVADLEALGLDGAAVWLQRFSGRIQALQRRVLSRAALELLLKLVRNVVTSPQEPKFRRIRADNPRIQGDLLGPGGEEAVALMSMLGFDATTEASGARVYVLNDAAFDCVRLRMGQELLENELRGTAPVPP